jgi:hypothetical protein
MNNDREYLTSTSLQGFVLGALDRSPRRQRLLACALWREYISHNKNLHHLELAVTAAEVLAESETFRTGHRHERYSLFHSYVVCGNPAHKALNDTFSHLSPDAYLDFDEPSPVTQSDIVRDALGYPLRDNPRGGLNYDNVLGVALLAKAAYEERTSTFCLDPDRLGVLSDALEEVGCENELALRHLRGESPCTCGGKDRWYRMIRGYPACAACNDSNWVKRTTPCYRGCWVLDTILKPKEYSVVRRVELVG